MRKTPPQSVKMPFRKPLPRTTAPTRALRAEIPDRSPPPSYPTPTSRPVSAAEISSYQVFRRRAS
ncbi:MAG: hypothetical protein RLZZ244_1807 [Verrucomicrobiota bacterium]|jgi:hypothetical protein